MGTGGWLALLETTEAPLASADDLWWRASLAIERTRCWVASADMYEAPLMTSAFTCASDADCRYVFRATNTSSEIIPTRFYIKLQ